MGRIKPFKTLVIILILGLITSCRSTTELTPRSLEKIASENSQLTADKLDLNITSLWEKDDKKVFWIDFNNRELCGVNYHCLYAIYHQYGESVTLGWRSYLDPRLPPDIKLIEKEIPCLIINQMNESKLNKYKVCPVGTNQYDITSSQTVNLN